MDYRRLIEFGKSSFVISLPKHWVKKNSLNKGDHVYLKEEQGNILISPKDKQFKYKPKKIVISTSNKDLKRIKSEIIAAYLNNFDIFIIQGNNLKDEAPTIKKFLKNLAGLELLEQEPAKIIAQDLMDLKEISIETLIRRIDIIIRSMIKDSMAGLHEDYLESIFHRDLDVNRLVFLIKRVIKLAIEEPSIAKKLNRNNRELLKDWNIVVLLESVGDEIKRISRFLRLNSKNKNIEEILAITSSLGKTYFEIMKSYHTKKIEAAYNFELTHQNRMAMINQLEQKVKDYQNIRLIYHLKSLASHLKNMSRTLLW